MSPLELSYFLVSGAWILHGSAHTLTMSFECDYGANECVLAIGRVSFYT